MAPLTSHMHTYRHNGAFYGGAGLLWEVPLCSGRRGGVSVPTPPHLHLSHHTCTHTCLVRSGGLHTGDSLSLMDGMVPCGPVGLLSPVLVYGVVVSAHTQCPCPRGPTTTSPVGRRSHSVPAPLWCGTCLLHPPPLLPYTHLPQVEHPTPHAVTFRYGCAFVVA